MKTNTFTLAVILLAGLLAASCHKTKEQEQQTEPLEAEPEERVYAMPDYHVYESVTVGKNEYTYDIMRKASDSLPLIEDELGAAKDNTITLRLTKNGKEYYNDTLTKRMFRSSMDDSFYSQSILMGIRFVSAEAGRGLTFSVGVSEPNSDMTIPFTLTVADNGSVSFVKDEVLDVDLPDKQTSAY
ncbi:MAG: DUF4738 domain-containing protein [Prevotellaceae bacterium]|nr:DUF4738 domain-containing protein [Prevotellaceae bacterium]MCD8303681.1 DUF4738 domain-containing protein [Prevotellaceae bacterium]